MVATAQGEMLLHTGDAGAETPDKHCGLPNGTYGTDGDGMVVYG